jgi:transcriptional regulator with XRE-family HTH domain
VGYSKKDVRDFLVSRRARLTPREAGLSHFGGNRRVPGLRREEVAMLAGVSVDYYTRLEKGGLAGASDSVLLAIGDALHLDDAERAHLFDLARAASQPVRARRRSGGAYVRPSVQWMLDAMAGMPALVTDEHLDVVGHNALAAAMFSPMFGVQGPRPNFARFAFLDPAARAFYPDWASVADMTTSMLRTAAGRNPHDRALCTLIGELSTRSDEFSRLWAAHDVRLHRSGVKTFDNPDVGRLTMSYEVLALTADPGLSLTVYCAEPGSPSADALSLLASLVATRRQAAADEHASPGSRP